MGSYTITGLYPDLNYAFFVRSRPVNGGVMDMNQGEWAFSAMTGCTTICSFTTAAPAAGPYDYSLFFTGPPITSFKGMTLILEYRHIRRKVRFRRRKDTFSHTP